MLPLSLQRTTISRIHLYDEALWCYRGAGKCSRTITLHRTHPRIREVQTVPRWTVELSVIITSLLDLGMPSVRLQTSTAQITACFILQAQTHTVLISSPYSPFYGSKQPRRRDLSNGPITPHSAHVLVKPSFLKEGAVVETKRYAFA